MANKRSKRNKAGILCAVASNSCIFRAENSKVNSYPLGKQVEHRLWSALVMALILSLYFFAINSPFGFFPYNQEWNLLLRLGNTQQRGTLLDVSDHLTPVPQNISRDEVEEGESQKITKPSLKTDEVPEEKETSDEITSSDFKGEAILYVGQPEVPSPVTASTTTSTQEESSQEIDTNASVILQDTIGDTVKEKDQLETYSQFAERVLAEKKNGAGNSNSPGGNGQSNKGPKVKNKNYASVECGAKFIAANPESSHSHKIINSNKDEYMLNKCTEKIWAVVELCESIRPQKFDIANFELFSNLPKDIQLYGSHRYPTREWIPLGAYVGEEGNRDIQSFHVETQEFVKFIKFEVNSYYGTEFFCPLSLFRIFGWSEFEVIDEVEDNEEEQIIEEPETKATTIQENGGNMVPDVIKSVVNGVLEVIKRGSRSGTVTDQPELNTYTQGCKSLVSNFTIRNETCSFADSLNYILACYYDEYLKLMLNPVLDAVVQNSYLCQQLASLICTSSNNNDSYVYDSVCNNSYACVMLSPKHILAMCHMKNSSLINDYLGCDTGSSNHSKNTTTNSTIKLGEKNVIQHSTDPFNVDSSDDMSKMNKLDGKVVSQIQASHEGSTKPSSKTKEKDAIHVPPTEHKQKNSIEKEEENLTVDIAANTSSKIRDDTDKTSNNDKKKERKSEHEAEHSAHADESSSEVTSTTASPPTTTVPSSSEGRVTSHSNKESIVVRLSNKIKVLEHNMSISSQYLEELSRRYKRQMEDMQRQFNITIIALNSTSQTAYERDLFHTRRLENLENQLQNLTAMVSTLLKEKENLLMNVIEQHMILLFVEVLVMCFVFSMCIKRRKDDLSRLPLPVNANGVISNYKKDTTGSQVNDVDHEEKETLSAPRRRSADNIINVKEDTKVKERRFSSQNPLTGSYTNLMIEASSKEKKKKKKKTRLERSLSNVSIHEVKRSSSAPSKKEKKLEKLRKSSAGVLFSGEKEITRISRLDKSMNQCKILEDVAYDDYQGVVVRRNKKTKNESVSHHSDDQPYVFSSDLKRKKITVIEEPLCSVYHQCYGDMLYDDECDIYGKNDYVDMNYKTDEQYEYYQELDLNQISSPPDVYVANFEENSPVVADYYQNSQKALPSKNKCIPEYTKIDDPTLWTSLGKSPRTSLTSSTFKGKTKLRSDNWEWYSSQPSRLLNKGIINDHLSNSSSDSSGRAKEAKPEYKTTEECKLEKKKKKKSKHSKISNGFRSNTLRLLG